MSLGTDGPQVEFGGFAPWLPLPVDGDDEAFLALVRDLFRDDPAPAEVVEASAHLLTDVAHQVAAQSDDDYLPVAAWVLLADQGRRLEPLTLLTFGALRTPPGFTMTDVVEQMCSEVELYQPPAIADLETASGDAARVQLRRYTGEGPDLLISEVVAVVWMSSTLDLAYVMSTTPIDDLVLASQVADAVVPLARTVRGLQ